MPVLAYHVQFDVSTVVIDSFGDSIIHLVPRRPVASFYNKISFIQHDTIYTGTTTWHAGKKTAHNRSHTTHPFLNRLCYNSIQAHP
ncbi:hypothetical protein EYC84_011586 [Monilinia fructicola]|uniref:Uncharacterized protein n=1 Tax=Monilinia fructicola TaxID=38448 RepID=A0A5M9J6G0_MONFR|nr:hypothetical protein EYC84_011586 [Monilinia fructicola]